MKKFAILTALAIAVTLTGCGTGSATPESVPATATVEPTMSSAAPSESTSPPADPNAFVVTSPDFNDGDELAGSVYANAFDGQCTGENINPALEWTNVPEGTVTLAIAMTDQSANGWVHWLHANITPDVTGVAAGGNVDLVGVAGRDQATGQPGYFGPCPPGPNHRYMFTIYALDTELALEEGFSFSDLAVAMQNHVIAQTAINGLASGPA